MQAAINEVRLPKSIVPVKYTVCYEDIDLKKFTFSGYVDIELNVKEETDFIMLNAKELSISNANYTIDGKVTEVEEIIVLKKCERLILKLEENLPVGTVFVHIGFAGILNDYMQGFYRSKYFIDGEERYMGTTQFESTDARLAFPCWDEPALKARFRVILTTPLNFTAVSNMPVLCKKTIEKHGEKKVVYEFDESPIMSTYLLAFVIGEFDCISAYTKEGVCVNCYTPIGKTGWGEFALRVGVHAVSYYNDFFNVPYPLKKLDLLPIPDFAAGAMENWGCVTFREVDLLIDEKTATIANKQRVAIVVSHEIAHMWFGDLVTMEWWTHLWLNEGFASYMEYKCVDDLFPEWRMPLEYYSDAFCTAFFDDSLKSTHPIEVPVESPDEIDQIFDGISYNKGSSVIHMLVSYIGEDAFRKGMEIYLNRHKYGNTCTEDLWRALGEGSGVDCEEIMKKWTGEPNYPLLVVEESENGEITSFQQVFFSNPNDDCKPSSWKIPLTIITPSGTQQVLYTNETKEEFNTLLSGLKKSEKWVKINQNTLCVVQYPASMLQKLATAVQTKELPALDRIQLVMDLKRLCNAQRVKPSTVLEFIESYEQEDDLAVVDYIASLIASFFVYVEDDIKPAYQQFTRRMLEKHYQFCGWDPKEGEDRSITTTRPVLLSALNSICEDEDIKKEAIRRYHEWMKNGDETLCHSEIRVLCMKEGVKEGSEKEARMVVADLMKKYKETTGAEQRRILAAIGQSQYPSILSTLLGYTFDGTIRKQDCYQSFACVSRNKEYKKMCWTYCKDNLKLLRDYLKKSFNMLGYFVECSGSVLDTKEEYEEFKEFYNNPEHQFKEVSRSVEIAEQAILLNISKKEYMHQYLNEFFQRQ